MCKPAKQFKQQINKYKGLITPSLLKLSPKQQDHLLQSIEIRVKK